MFFYQNIMLDYSESLVATAYTLGLQVMTDEAGKSKGFGFVSYEDPESAEKVCKIYCDLKLQMRKLNFYIGLD